MSTSSTDLLAAGRVGRPHGLDGSFHVTQPRSRALVRGARVTVAGRELEIVRRAGTEERPILRLAGVDDREAVEGLRGTDLLVRRGDMPALGEDEWYAEDLEGLAVHDADVTVGVVSRLVAYPSCEVLEVSREGADPLLVPLVSDAVRAVDLAAGRIDIDLRFLGE